MYSAASVEVASSEAHQQTEENTSGKEAKPFATWQQSGTENPSGLPILRTLLLLLLLPPLLLPPLLPLLLLVNSMRATACLQLPCLS
jgi:hypothetical protein